MIDARDFPGGKGQNSRGQRPDFREAKAKIRGTKAMSVIAELFNGTDLSFGYDVEVRRESAETVVIRVSPCGEGGPSMYGAYPIADDEEAIDYGRELGSGADDPDLLYSGDDGYQEMRERFRAALD
ncbi:MAG TPA: hypothetical protein VFD92_04765 [Candidatus Binatia bacterium]|nr:hypothetical protein [Candidatus Binatia bacterium]